MTPGTLYYVRAYATNEIGTSYGAEISFTASAVTPSLSTTAISSITSATAVSGGTISSTGGATVTATGVCWGTSTGPTTSNSTAAGSANSGTFTASLTGLTPGTLYYVRAYASNSVGTGYGAEVTFTTAPVVPTLSTTALGSITATSATSGGSVSATGGASITANGLCWSTNTSPTTADTTTTDTLVQAGSFTSSLTGLTEGLVYYVRAYATNAAGTAYGNELSFTAENSLTFTYTGAQQTFTVPTGVTLVTIECWGASGGDGFTAGGKGGYAKGVKTVTAGGTLYVNVGGQGSSGGGDGVRLAVSGGWNGGGSGYSDTYNTWGKIGGGGGASDVRPDVIGFTYTTTLHTPFIVAGGGGGGTSDSSLTATAANQTAYPGGDGGGDVGGNVPITAYSWVMGGRGGNNFTLSGDARTWGGYGVGYSAPNNAGWGGGGGGGFEGGGYGRDAAGGGGSGYLGKTGYGGGMNKVSGSYGTLTAGVNTGNGKVKITW